MTKNNPRATDHQCLHVFFYVIHVYQGTAEMKHSNQPINISKPESNNDKPTLERTTQCFNMQDALQDIRQSKFFSELLYSGYLS